MPILPLLVDFHCLCSSLGLSFPSEDLTCQKKHPIGLALVVSAGSLGALNQWLSLFLVLDLDVELVPYLFLFLS